MEKDTIRATPSTARIVAFRTITTILVIGMLSGGITALFRIEYQVDLFKHLGYPLFLMTIIGVGKILAAIVLLLPRNQLLKIGAYVGIFIVSVCAFISHLVAGDSAALVINPLVLTAITLAAYFLNPNMRFEPTYKEAN